MRPALNLCQQTAAALIPLLDAGQTTCVAVMESVLDQIDQRESDVGAFVKVRGRDELLAEAKAVDDRRAAGETIGALAGLPVAIKDNICTKGLATSCSSKMLKDFVPPYDATVVEKIVAADGIILGKTNMDEFAMGSSTENSAMGITKNPRDLSRVPGGSSGGSAAAVAADMTILALGSDTGGSIRQPASFCGVVGMKPTYGRVSRYGLIAYASSLDQIGPITKCVEDAALLLSVIRGHDPKDSTSLDAHYPAAPADGAKAGETYRLGVPAEYTRGGTDPAVQAAVDQTIAKLEAWGHTIVPIELPHTDYAIPTYYLIASAEASSNLSRYAGYAYGHRAENPTSIDDMIARSRAEGFGDEVKRRIMLGTYALSSGYDEQYYEKALRVRRLIQQDFDAAFKKCDFIVHAVAPHPAFKLVEKTDDPLAMYLEDIFSVTANLAGLPAISVPVPQAAGDLPIGVQCVAPALQEAELFVLAGLLEDAVAATAG
ncbi:MAG: Asp-tRNA(Asn)/Glu-tRNA(Gln) amidotransferase subunit GatA [Planctomycetota bacterium]